MALNNKVDTFKYWFLHARQEKLLNQYQATTSQQESAIAKQTFQSKATKTARLGAIGTTAPNSSEDSRGTRNRPRDARPSYRRESGLCQRICRQGFTVSKTLN